MSTNTPIMKVILSKERQLSQYLNKKNFASTIVLNFLLTSCPNKSPALAVSNSLPETFKEIP